MEGLKGLKDFEDMLRESGFYPLRAEDVRVLQLNLGGLCNQSCKHCHVEAGPQRSEVMSKETMECCLRVVDEYKIGCVDITGGAPEMNPHYRWLVEECARRDTHLIVRTNLTILTEDGYRDIPELLATGGAEVVASLPHYTEAITDRVRGKGVFRASIEALKVLNSLGYADEGSGLTLNLMYNAAGAYMPASQKRLEEEFREGLSKYGVRFNNLYTLVNMPVGRFLVFLRRSGNLFPYMKRLVAACNRDTIGALMCRTTVSVGWDGTLYDCDFNQMLSLRCNSGAPYHIKDFHMESLKHRIITTGLHCYGCTAGSGSSCTGEIS